MFRSLIALLSAVTIFGGAAIAGPVDQAEISRSITDVAAGADRSEWDRVRAAFADEVTVDYTSLWGWRTCDPIRK